MEISELKLGQDIWVMVEGVWYPDRVKVNKVERVEKLSDLGAPITTIRVWAGYGSPGWELTTSSGNTQSGHVKIWAPTLTDMITHIEEKAQQVNPPRKHKVDMGPKDPPKVPGDRQVG